MATGTVKWFNATKGYGFIQPDNGSADVFVHISAVEKAGLRSLNENDKYSYDLVSEKGKTSASNLQKDLSCYRFLATTKKPRRIRRGFFVVV